VNVLFWQDPQFGDRMITLMAALVLVLQITMVTQRWLVTAIRAFAIQSLLLAGIANTIAYYNRAPHIYVAAAMTLLFKTILLPVILGRLVTRIEMRQEIEPLVNVPVSVIISGLLTMLAYVVAEPLKGPVEAGGVASLGRNTLPVAIALFLIGFFLMVTRKKALTQVLALLSLENGLFLAAISLTYGMPLIIELGIFFDVLVAVMILAILVYRIRETFDSIDVSRLSRLRG
jgi:hydrogenase-4 component E